MPYKPHTARRLARQIINLSSRLAAERLEPRAMMAGVAGDGEDPRVVSLEWEGRRIEALRDSYIVQMPALRSTPGATEYRSAEPAVVAGWLSRPIGSGFYEVAAPGSSVEQVANWAKAIGAESLSPNVIFRPQAVRREPNDTLYRSGLLWGLDNPNKTLDADIDAPEAWTMQTGSKDIIVAVMDSGTDYTHRDLQQNLWNRDVANAKRPAGVPAIPKDRFGRYGWDSVNNDDDVWPLQGGPTPTADDYPNSYANPPYYDQHGTEVAGIIGAKGSNAEGSVGVNWDVSIYTAKIFNDRELKPNTYVQWPRWLNEPANVASLTRFIDACDRIIELRTTYQQNIAVVNMSFGWYNGFPIPAMNATIGRLNAAGILVVAAAGNNHLTSSYGTSDPFYPAAYELPGNNVIAVAASDQNDKLTDFTNWGSWVDIAAPGVKIWSTIPTGNPPKAVGNPLGYRDTSDQPPTWATTTESVVTGGTSMAAPFVTGVAALVAAEFRRYTGKLPSPTFIRRAILEGADIKPSLRVTFDGKEKFVAGDRRLNAEGALKWCRDNLPPNIIITADKMPGRIADGQFEGDTGEFDYGFTAKLVNNKTSQPITAATDIFVEYFTEDWEARSGIDYVGVSAGSVTFTIPAGKTEGKFNIKILGDAEPERYYVPAERVGVPDRRFGIPAERFKVRFGNTTTGASDSDGREPVVRTDMVVGTILDDDPDREFPAVVIPATAAVTVGARGNDVRVSLNAGSATQGWRATTVSYRVTQLYDAEGNIPPDAAIPGVDFIAQTGQITIPAGRTEAVIPLRILKNEIPGDRRFLVELTDPRPGLLKRGQTQCVVSMMQASVPVLTVTSVPPTPIIERTGRNTVLFVGLSLNTPTSVPVTLSYRFLSGVDPKTGVNYGTATERADFIGGSGRITIRPGETMASIPFTILGDSIDERDESAAGVARDEERFTLLLDKSSIRGATLGTETPVTLTIRDDDEQPPVPARSFVASGAAAAFGAFGADGWNGSPPSTTRRRR